MGLLDGGVAAAFAGLFSNFYLDAQLYPRSTSSDDGRGGGSGTGFGTPIAVKAQLDQVTEAMRQAEGYTDTDQRILVLASGVDQITTEFEIEVGGTRWSIASVSQDPAKAYYDLRGRRKSAA